VDGLEAERQQGITIDVAYRFFSTDKRKFIVADTPGHEQYTRNMATGASNSELAVILIDARKGVLTQTRRHAYIVSLLGIRHVVLAVNKIDLVDFPKAYSSALCRVSEFLGKNSISNRKSPSRFRRAMATMSSHRVSARLGTRAHRCSIICNPSTWRRSWRQSRSACRCSG